MIRSFVRKLYMRSMDIYDEAFTKLGNIELTSIIKILVELETLCAQFPLLLKDAEDIARFSRQLRLRQHVYSSYQWIDPDKKLIDRYIAPIRPFIFILQQRSAFELSSTLGTELNRHSSDSAMPFIGHTSQRFLIDTIVKHDVFSLDNLPKVTSQSMQRGSVTVCEFAAVQTRLRSEAIITGHAHPIQLDTLRLQPTDWVFCEVVGAEEVSCKAMLPKMLPSELREELEFVRQRQRQVCSEGYDENYLFLGQEGQSL